ncbi:MAG: formate dehydrogenase accessory sulfurtransferase FdhD [Methanospirillaceae archaeon]|nr:formate dehydrogenase accessory sulfurtransferase FdhD [Methanospirillaceae archaeon]
MFLTTTPAFRYTKNGNEEIIDEIVCEKQYEIYVNDTCITRQVASPGLLAEMGAGFVITEQLADTIVSVSVKGSRIFVEANGMHTALWSTESAGGFSNLKRPRKVSSSLCIPQDAVFSVFETIQSEQWQKTGGLHTAVLFRDKEVLIRCPDIGRHNTIDKAVGYALLQRIDPANCYLGCTGRQPEGMVRKAANAGIPIIISRAATTDRGVAAARDAGLTLIGFARGERFTIYTHPERIISHNG